jgi:hypothetical protein
MEGRPINRPLTAQNIMIRDSNPCSEQYRSIALFALQCRYFVIQFLKNFFTEANNNINSGGNDGRYAVKYFYYCVEVREEGIANVMTSRLG